MHNRARASIHTIDELVDLFHPGAPISTLGLSIAMAFVDIPSTRRRQLEGPQKIGDGLEIWPCCIELMHHVLNSMDAVLAKLLIDDGVVHQGNAILVHLAKATFVEVC